MAPPVSVLVVKFQCLIPSRVQRGDTVSSMRSLGHYLSFLCHTILVLTQIPRDSPDPGKLHWFFLLLSPMEKNNPTATR